MPATKLPHPPAPDQAGFSLVELLVSVVIMAEILVGVSILFDSSSRLARAQTHVAELQQSLRVGQSEVVRFARAAGVGGLPITRSVLPAGEPAKPPNYDLLGAFPRGGYAVSVLNDFTGTVGTDQVVPGSDVLILRGVFTTPLYYFDPPIDISTWLDALPIDDKTVVIPDRQRAVGKISDDYPQDISALSQRLLEAKSATRPMAFILRDTMNPNAYTIMEFDQDSNTVPELTPVACTMSADADEAQCITVKLGLDITSEPGLSYAKLISGTSLLPGLGGMTLTLPAGSDPPSVDPFLISFPTNVGSLGMLEEYRFFVRVEYEVPGKTDTHLTPVLSRASFLPGTDTLIERVDIADNVIDLQIAIGADADDLGDAGYGDIADNDDSDDEILFNSTDDTSGSGDYNAPAGAVNWYDPDLEYHFLRINTLVQSRLPDREHIAPMIDEIEDYNRGASFAIGSETYRYNQEYLYHRRWLQTVVELRNLQ